MKKEGLEPGYRELIKHKDYIFVLALSMLSSFGFIIFQVVLFWLAYKMSESTFKQQLSYRVALFLICCLV